jgi:uncharacterized lipoprotein YmbA
MRRVVRVCVVVGVAGWLSACGSTSEPQQTFRVLGQNTYSLVTSDESAAVANAHGLQMAQRFCATQGKQSQTQSGQSQFANDLHHFALEFTCV